MKIFGQAVSISLTLAFLVALGMGGYFAIDYVIGLFINMDAQIAKVTVIASVVMLLVATLIASSIHQADKQSRAHQISAHKIAIYEQLVDTWARLLQVRFGSEKHDPILLAEALHSLGQPLALYGSPVIIKAHSTLYALVTGNGTQNQKIRMQFSKVLQEIRKDTGSNASGITPEELCDLILPDNRQHEACSVGLAVDSR